MYTISIKSTFDTFLWFPFYLKLTFVISLAFICYALHVSPILFCVDVLITQYFLNNPLTEIEDCFWTDIVTYRRIRYDIVHTPHVRLSLISGGQRAFSRDSWALSNRQCCRVLLYVATCISYTKWQCFKQG